MGDWGIVEKGPKQGSPRNRRILSKDLLHHKNKPLPLRSVNVVSRINGDFPVAGHQHTLPET